MIYKVSRNRTTLRTRRVFDGTLSVLWIYVCMTKEVVDYCVKASCLNQLLHNGKMSQVASMKQKEQINNYLTTKHRGCQFQARHNKIIWVF